MDLATPRKRLSSSNARRKLGVELRNARGRAGLTLAQAAKAIQRSAPTLSRLETGEAVPRLVDVKALLDHYGVVRPDAVSERVRDRILDLADNARDQEWFTSFRDVLGSDITRDDLAQYVSYENEALEIRSFEPDLVPGLLQTEGYAAAVVEQYFPDRTEDERARLVEFRMRRQQVLTRAVAPLRLRVVVSELVVIRVTASIEVMSGQLEKLLGHLRGGTRNVDLSVVPASLGMPAAVGGPFVVMSLPAGEPDLVYLESREGATYRRDDVARARYAGYFDDLVKAAYPLERAVELLEGALTKL